MGEASKVGKRGPAVTVPVEVWSPERKAAFLLENAVDDDDYEWSRAEVRRMGLDPDQILHGRPWRWIT